MNVKATCFVLIYHNIVISMIQPPAAGKVFYPFRLFLFFLVLAGVHAHAQMPQCGLIYYQMGRNIWNYDPRLPVSATNPVVNSIMPPAQFQGLTISEPLNAAAGASATFYTTVNGIFYYYDGTRWVNTGHGTGNMAGVNIGSGGGLLYNLVGGTGEVYKYDGRGDAQLLTRVPNFSGEGPYDLIADCVGNWYILNSSGVNSPPFLRKYDPAGNIIQEWTITNPQHLKGNGGFGIIGTTIYYDSNTPFGVVTGTIGATTVTINNNVTAFPVFVGAADMASCAAAVPVSPDVTISASQTDICSGDRVIFRATPVNGGTAPLYQWVVNGANMGTTADSFIYIPSQGDRIYCVITSSASCASVATATSNTITMVVHESNLVPAVTITNTGNGFCDSLPTILLAHPVNGGPNPFYQWQKNGLNVGGNTRTYTDNGLVNGDILQVLMTSNARCLSTVPVNSNTLAVVITPAVVPGININTIPPTTLCEGTPITFLSNDVGGGPTPQYQWYRNNQPIPGATNTTYTDLAPADGDTIMVVLTSSEACPTMPSTGSNRIGLTVSPYTTPSVTISVSPGTTFTPGQPVTFTASATNGGLNPVFEWRRNNVPVAGATGPVWVTRTLRDGDVVTVRIESNAPCPQPATATADPVTMRAGTTGFPGIHGDDNVCALYPNPNTGSFTLDVRLATLQAGVSAEISIIDAIGRKIYALTMPKGLKEWTLPIDLGTAIAAGAYMLQVHAPGVQVVKSFVITR